MKEKEEKKSKLQEALAKLNKDYGAGTVITGKDKGLNIPSVSTGSLKIDLATGIGGLPYGRIVEIYGPESSGKTTVCLQTVANAQKAGKKVAYIDMEHALDLNYAMALGVDIDELLISQPMYGEEAMNIAKMLIETDEVGMVVIDSVAALVPKAELEGEIGDANVGKQSRLMSQSLRMLTPLAEEKGTLMIFTNQLREKIGVMFGSPETTTGGNALKFYASIRIDIRKSIDKENQGNKTRVKLVKNKMARPFGEAEIFIEWGKGVNVMNEVADLAVDMNIISKAGSWYSYGDMKLGQGLSSVTNLFQDNDDFYTEIREKVIVEIKNRKNETSKEPEQQTSDSE